LQAAIKALNSKDKAEIDRLMLSEVTRLFRLYVDASEKLSTYQLKSTAEQYAESQASYERSMTLAIVPSWSASCWRGIRRAAAARGDGSHWTRRARISMRWPAESVQSDRGGPQG
jgi:hypothetical protein